MVSFSMKRLSWINNGRIFRAFIQFLLNQTIFPYFIFGLLIVFSDFIPLSSSIEYIKIYCRFLKVSGLRSDCEKAQLSERQLRERNGELESMLEEAQERVRQKISMLNETTSEEIAGLHAEIGGLQNDKVSVFQMWLYL